MVQVGETVYWVGLRVNQRGDQYPVGFGDIDDPHGAGCGIDLMRLEGEYGVWLVAFKNLLHLGGDFAADAEDGVQSEFPMVCEQGA